MRMAPTRALVLGGGGVTGVAWEIGIAAALAEAGADLDQADLVVGTSAGSVVGALLRSGTPVESLYRAQLAPPVGEIAARMGPGMTIRLLAANLFPGSERNARKRIGRAALRARTVGEEERLAAIRSRLPSLEWPAARLLITSVDAESGEAVVFDRNGSASLLEAVSASCAVPMVWPPVTIGGHRYIDGGMRSVANADLATGCERVLVLAPLTFALRPGQRISRQLAALGEGVRSQVVTPDPAALRAIGPTLLDPSRRAASAEAGRAQGERIAAQVAGFWNG